MKLEEAIEILKNSGFNVMDEDFGIGVGAPCGLDQGIPHGGDGKGCCPQRMGLFQRSPYSLNPLYKGVPDAHHPEYWLRQLPKKKKRKKIRKRKLSENSLGFELPKGDIFDCINDFKEACFKMYCKYFKKDDNKNKHQSDHDLRKDFTDGFTGVEYRPTRAATAGRWAKGVALHLDHAGTNIADCLKKFKFELKLLKDVEL